MARKVLNTAAGHCSLVSHQKPARPSGSNVRVLIGRFTFIIALLALTAAFLPGTALAENDHSCNRDSKPGNHGDGRGDAAGSQKCKDHNDAPISSAGDDATVTDAAIIFLSGVCWDSDTDDTLTGSWAQTGGTSCGPIDGATDNDTGGELSITVSCTAPDVAANEVLTFQFTCDDGTETANDTVVITVNAKPSATAQSVSTDEEAAKAITLAGADPNNEVLSYSIVENPSHGSLSGVAPDVTYLPADDYNGNDFFTFRVNDGLQVSDEATISISVGSVNDIPIANAGPDQSGINPADGVVMLSGIQSSDPDGDPLTYVWTVTPPSGVTMESLNLSGPTTAQPTFTPTKAGTYTFQLIVNDGTINSNPDTVDIVVEDVPPVITIEEAGKRVEYDPAAGNITLQTAIVDINDDFYEIVWEPVSAPDALVFVDTNTIDMTNYQYKKGTYQYRQKVTANGMTTYSDPVTIIMPDNRPEEPELTAITFEDDDSDVTLAARGGRQVFEYAGFKRLIELKNIVFSDYDGDNLSYTWLTANDALEFVSVGDGELTLRNKKAGTKTIKVTASDGELSKEMEINIYIPPPEWDDDKQNALIIDTTADGADTIIVEGQVNSLVVPIIVVNGKTIATVEDMSAPIMKAVSSGGSYDTYRFSAAHVPVGSDPDSISVDIYTDVDGIPVALASKALSLGTVGGSGEKGSDQLILGGGTWGCSLTPDPPSTNGNLITALLLFTFLIAMCVSLRVSCTKVRRNKPFDSPRGEPVEP